MHRPTSSGLIAILALVFLLPGAAGEARAANDGCALRAEVTSPSEGRPTVVRFLNDGPVTVRVLSIDSRGRETLEAEIAAGATLLRDTYQGQMWLVTNQEGDCLGVYAATIPAASVVIGSDADRATKWRGAASRCPGEAALKAASGEVPAVVEFLNEADSERRVYWLDYDGHRKLFAKLPAGKSIRQRTFLTHPLVVVDQSGACVGIYFADSAERKIFLPRH